MKKLQLTLIALLLSSMISAQNNFAEKYGRTLNMGLGIGYYGYVGYSIPVLHANYEIDVAKNFTIAPFITFYSYKNDYYWGNNRKPYRYYKYSETVVPIGAKGSYYFDDILKASPKWDFYLAGSLGFVIRRTLWDSDYEGIKTVRQGTGPLYIDLHVGTEYHFNKKAGLFLDLSTGVSTLGLALKL